MSWRRMHQTPHRQTRDLPAAPGMFLSALALLFAGMNLAGLQSSVASTRPDPVPWD
jgi:hypothetical protein